MAAKKKPVKDPYAGPAQAASLLRYGPELSTLTALLKAAEQSQAERVRAAGATRQQIQGSIMEARPQVKAGYGAAQSQANASFAAAGRPAGIEGGALAARLAESSALSTRQLAQRDVSAVEGAGAARDQALRDFRSDRGKIGDRASALSQEMGAFASSTASELRGADASAAQRAAELAANLAQSDRNSRRSANTARANSQRSADTAAANRAARDTAKDAADAAKKWLPQEKQAHASDHIQTLLTPAAEYKAQGITRADAAAALKIGQTAQPIYDTVQVKDKYTQKVTGTKQVKRLNADGTPQMTKPVPKAESQLLLSASLDMAYDGHLSRRNQGLLHERGIKLKPLGLVTYAEWLKKQRPMLPGGADSL